jgi:hypothetical protein
MLKNGIKPDEKAVVTRKCFEVFHTKKPPENNKGNNGCAIYNLSLNLGIN